MTGLANQRGRALRAGTGVGPVRPPVEWTAWEREELARMRRDGYGPSSIAKLLVDLGRRGRVAAAASPRRARSTCVWLAVGVIGGLAASLELPRAAGCSLDGVALGVWGAWAVGCCWLVWNVQGLALRGGIDPAIHGLGVPNGLSVWRILLGPLVSAPVLSLGPHGPWAPWLALGMVLLAAGDLVDGWYARRFGWVTPLGARLDPLGDVVLWVCTVWGLWRVGVVPGWFALVALVRYPGAIAGVLVTYAVYGPVPVRGTPVGKVLSFAVSLLLLALSVWHLLWPGQPRPAVATVGLAAAAALMVANYAYLAQLAVAEGRARIAEAEAKGKRDA